jgi:hypothetical protein
MKKRTIITFSIILAFLCVLPLLIYAVKFYTYPISNNPSDWGNFGDYIGGLLSPVFALIGIFAATYVTILANQIQKQQIRPVGNIILGDYENHLYVDLRNGGLGPLIVKSLKVKNSNSIEKINIIEFMPNNPNRGFWDNYINRIDERVIAPSDKINLIRLRTDLENNNQIKFRDSVRKHLATLTIQVEYTDVFGNAQPTLTKSLVFFSFKISHDESNPLNNKDKKQTQGVKSKK